MANDFVEEAPRVRPGAPSSATLQLRLLLEELCCELCRFQHVRDGLAPEAVRIDREFQLGATDAFADIRVEAPGAAPFFVENKLAYAPADLIDRLLAERPRVAGLAVPGMPIGSPGMEVPGQPAQRYEVLTFDARGETKVFAVR